MNCPINILMQPGEARKHTHAHRRTSSRQRSGHRCTLSQAYIVPVQGRGAAACTERPSTSSWVSGRRENAQSLYRARGDERGVIRGACWRWHGDSETSMPHTAASTGVKRSRATATHALLGVHGRGWADSRALDVERRTQDRRWK